VVVVVVVIVVVVIKIIIIYDKNNLYLIQDNYNLKQDDKWDLVYNFLLKKIPIINFMKKKNKNKKKEE